MTLHILFTVLKDLNLQFIIWFIVFICFSADQNVFIFCFILSFSIQLFSTSWATLQILPDVVWRRPRVEAAGVTAGERLKEQSAVFREKRKIFIDWFSLFLEVNSYSILLTKRTESIWWKYTCGSETVDPFSIRMRWFWVKLWRIKDTWASVIINQHVDRSV